MSDISKQNIKTAAEINHIREAAKVSTQIMSELREAIEPGISPADLDRLMGELCEREGVIPAFQGVDNFGGGDPFPGNLCVCVNDEVLHGIPKKDIQLKVGDLVKVDLGIIHGDFYTDHCTTVAIREILPEDESLLKTGKFAVESAVDKVAPGVKTGDLGYAMQSVAKMAGFDVLKEYVGHGIGTELWEPPQIPAYGVPGSGYLLKPGMVISVEAQVVPGSDEVYIDKDDWTVKTVDGNKGVMFEYMVLVTDEGKEVLTDTRDWPLVI